MTGDPTHPAAADRSRIGAIAVRFGRAPGKSRGRVLCAVRTKPREQAVSRPMRLTPPDAIQRQDAAQEPTLSYLGVMRLCHGCVIGDLTYAVVDIRQLSWLPMASGG
jgi:hypothetical protein